MHIKCSIAKWASWICDVLLFLICTDKSDKFIISPPFFPVSEIILAPIFFATFAAEIIFLD